MPVSLEGYKILVVEDDFMNAEALIDMLTDAGATPLGPVGTIDSAEAFIDTHVGALDRVILDLDLHGQRSYPIASKLAALNLPFVFVSGYSLDSIEAPFRSFPRCEKPVVTSALLGMLAAAA